MSDSTKISNLIESALHKIRELADADTIIGREIHTADGTTIIPISKMSVGFVSGGLDYSGKKRAKDGAKEYADGDPHFGGGGGTGISVSPVAFLVVSPDGKVDVLPISPPPSPMQNSADKFFAILDRVEQNSPKWLAKIKSFFSKKSDADDLQEDVTDENNEQTEATSEEASQE